MASHKTADYQFFLNRTVPERSVLANKKRAYFICLSVGHTPAGFKKTVATELPKISPKMIYHKNLPIVMLVNSRQM